MPGVRAASVGAGQLRGPHLPLVSLAEEEERAPGVRRGEQQREEAGQQGEAAGGRRAPLLHGEALALLHRQVGAQPHALGEEQAAAAEVVAILGQRHHHHEAEQEGQEVAGALHEEEIVERHGGARRAEGAAGGGRGAGWRRGTRGAGRQARPRESPGAARTQAGSAREAAQWRRRRGPARPARDACAAAERGPRLRSAPRTAPGGLAARKGGEGDNGWVWATLENGCTDAEAEWKPGVGMGRLLCRLTETRLWYQELPVWASHRMVPRSPVAPLALRKGG